MDIVRTGIELLSGALTGYITNSIAVKMLFKNYGPFGGVIVKTRDEFIENVSQLVERDIINENTLQNILNQVELNKWIEYFLEQALVDNMEELIIANLPGIDQTKDNFIDFFNMYSKKHHQDLSSVFSNIKIEELISDKQFEYFSEQQINRLLNYTSNSSKLKRQFNLLFSGINNKSLKLLFPHKMINILTENTLNTFRDYRTEPEFINNKLNLIMKKTCLYIDIEGICRNLLKRVERKKLKDYKIDEKYLSSILEKTGSFISSSAGEKALLLTCQRITDSIRKEQLTISSFLNKKTAKILDNKIDGTLNVLADWINENHNSIDNIFDKTLITVLDKEEYQSNWKAILKKNIYTYYFKKSRLTPSQILASSLTEPVTKHSLKTRILTELDRVLGSIITNKKEDYKKVNLFINKYINQLQQKSSAYFTDNTIANFIDLSKFKPDSLYSNNFVIKQITEKLMSNFEKGIKNISTINLNNFFQSGGVEKYYQKLTSILKNKRDYLKKGLEKLYKTQKSKTLDQIINTESGNMPGKFLASWIKEQFTALKKLRVNNLLLKINYHAKINEKKGEILLSQFLRNLPDLFHGKISAIIKNNLKSVNDNDLKKMLENLIGRELKPITYFGAFLGIFSAFLIYLLRTNIGVFSLFQLPVSMITYGAIGYITNVIAIKMVFRPYQKKKFLGLSLPFTPGVISKEKSRFASSVGNFIDRELLNAKTIKNTLQNKKIYIQDIIAKTLAGNRYQLPRRLLLENKTGILGLIPKKKDLIIKKTAKLTSTDFSGYSSVLSTNIENYFTRSSSNIAKEVYLLLNKKRDNSLSSIVPESLLNGIIDSANIGLKMKIDNCYLLLKDSSGFESTLKCFIDDHYENIKDYQAADLTIEIKDSISDFLYNMLKAIAISGSPGIKVYINNLLNSKTMLFLKNAPDLLEANKYRLKDGIKRYFKAKLGFWAKVGKLVDIDLTLDEFIDTFITDGLPEIINTFLNENSGDILELSADEVSLIIEELFSNNEIRKIIIENINFLIDNSSLSLNDIFRILDLEKPSQLIDIFSEELSFLKENLAGNLKNNKESLIEEYKYFIQELLEQFFNSIELKSLLINIDQGLIKETLENLYRELNTSDQVRNLLSIIIKEQLSPNQIDTILREDYLEEDLNELYNNLVKNEDVHSLLNKIYLNTVEALPEIIDKQTGDYIINIVVSSIFSTLEKLLPQLVEEIDIKKIAVEQIENMDSRKIEDLFYSFAGNYFTKLEHYGWLGAIFGLLAALVNLSI